MLSGTPAVGATLGIPRIWSFDTLVERRLAALRNGSGQEAGASGSNKKPDDDQADPVENLSADQIQNSGDDEHGR